MERKSILPDFQAFLLSHKLVPDKNIPYYAHWAGKFLDFCNKNTQSDHKKLVLEFMDSLQKDKDVPDWQIRQAHQAVQLYLANFKGKVASDAVSLSAGTVAKGLDIPQIINEMKRILLLKNAPQSPLDSLYPVNGR